MTICCVSNPVGGDLIGNAWWSGVRIADLLEEAGVQAGADAVKQTSQDGWTCGTPIEALTDDRNAMLAVAMNGRPLPVDHGFPVRMIVPGLYGYVSATKWVVDLEVTRFADFTAYWTDRGWSSKGPVKTESRVEVPRDGSDVGGRRRSASAGTPGRSTPASRRWSTASTATPGGRPSSAGSPATTPGCSGPARSTYAAGSHTLAVRATDRSGYTQTAARADVVPDGATGWHSVSLLGRLGPHQFGSAGSVGGGRGTSSGCTT